MIRLEAFWVKSIEYRKARKAWVINSKARVKPETRALKKAGLLSIPIRWEYFSSAYCLAGQQASRNLPAKL